MKLFRLVSWPYARKHALRSLLTLIGIVIGVAVFVSMHVANQSVMGSFKTAINRIAGATELQISAGEPGMDEEVLERVQAVREVRVAVPVIEAVVGTRLAGQGNLLILGVDMTGDRSLRDYDMENAGDAMIEDPLIFLAQPDSLMVTSQFAARNGLQVDSRVALETTSGVKEFVVRGVLKSGGLNSAMGGNLAIMDVYAAQHIFGRGRKFDRIDLALLEGTSVEAGRAAIEAALGPGFQVESPATRGQNLQSLLQVYEFMLRFSSAFALLIGMFIIYNCFAIAVAQRRFEIGLLRALGATRGQIQRLFLGEGLLAGVLGSMAGLLLGVVAARAVARSLSGLLSGIYGVPDSPTPVELTPAMAVLAVAVGAGASAVAALLPARTASRIDPVRALQRGGAAAVSPLENRVRLYLAAACGLVYAACAVLWHSRGTLLVGVIAVTTAALLLAPQLTLWLTRCLRPLLCRAWPVEGALAADSLIASPRRTSGTVAALMCSLGLVVSLGGGARSAYSNIGDWVDNVLNPDLYVTPSQSLVVRSYKFPESMAADLAGLPGVDEIQAVRTAYIPYGGHRTSLLALEMDKQARRTHRVAAAGNLERMYAAAHAGEGVIVSEILSIRRNVHLGDRLEIPTPRGILSLPVVGVVRDYAEQQGAIMVGRQVYKEWWNDDTVDIFRVYVKPGVSPAVVKDAVLNRFAGNRRLFVLLNEDVRKYVLRTVDQWFSVTWIQIAVALVVAILGIVNSLTVSVTDRRSELAVLQAVGGLPRQLRLTIWIEAMSVGAIGVVLGLALGAAYLYFFNAQSAMDGMPLDYIYPASLAALLLPLIMAVSFLAALGPGESAVRASLIEGLAYE